MDACESPRADARVRGPSRTIRPGTHCPRPLAGAVRATASRYLGPGSVEHTFWYHEVPRLHEPSRFALAVEVPRLSRRMLAERLQVLFFDEELLLMLLQKPAHPRGRERRAPLERVVHDGGEIEVFDH